LAALILFPWLNILCYTLLRRHVYEASSYKEPPGMDEQKISYLVRMRRYLVPTNIKESTDRKKDTRRNGAKGVRFFLAHSEA